MIQHLIQRRLWVLFALLSWASAIWAIASHHDPYTWFALIPGVALIGLSLTIEWREVKSLKSIRGSQTKTMSAALKKISMQQQALDEHAIVAHTDPSGKITYANDKFCAISGYSRDELIGQNHRIVNSGMHPRSFFSQMWKTITSGQVWKGDVCNRAKDGSLYWVHTTIFPYLDKHGNVAEYIAIRMDITERKAQEQILRKARRDAEAANRAKTEFLANMSHEIRSPMTAILGFTDTLGENIVKPENVEAISIIKRNGENLIKIINDILDLSKIEADKMRLERVVCEPSQIVSEVIDLMRVRADAKGLELHTEFQGPIPETINTDPARLRQILINLLGNAIKFTEEGTVKLLVRCITEPANHKSAPNPKKLPCLQFDVIDTGIGISDEHGAMLFQPFMQADTSATRKFGGTGLGLTISKRFAELLDGDITLVESKVGQGTCFRVTVATGSLEGVKMLINPQRATTGTPAITLTSHATIQGLNILFAEDGPDNQKLISFFLKKAGAQVTVVENGKLALDAAQDAAEAGKAFDCILMDMQMPVMDGYEATGRLRAQNYTGPIIALTAHAMDGDRDKCINAGCDDYATKPVDRKQLIAMIARHARPWSAAA